MNVVHILGTITRDIDIRYTQGGTAIASFSIAYNERYKNQAGEQIDKSHFFDCTAFGRTAEVINQYFHKGSRILVSGSLDQQTWTAQDGTNRSKVGIKVNAIDFIDKKPSQSNGNGQNTANNTNTNADTPPTQQNAPKPPEIDINEDEIPF